MTTYSTTPTSALSRALSVLKSIAGAAIYGAFWLVAILVMAVTGCIAYGEHTAINTWDVFASEHQCKKVGEQKGGTVLDIRKSALATHPDTKEIYLSSRNRTAYVCDDGITYWR